MKIKNFLKSILCFLFVFILGSALINKPEKALADSKIDEFLISTGMSQEEVNNMTENQKNYIYETLDDNAVFSSYEEKEFIIDNNEMKEVQTRAGSIADGDLTLSVAAYTTIYNGVSCYIIYPSFIWSKVVKVQNDSFSMAMFQDWEVIPGAAKNLRLWMKNIYGDKVQNCDLSPSVASSYGYSYKVPSNTGSVQGLYEGNAYMYAKKKSSDATQGVSLNYTYDASTMFNTSYSISIGAAYINLSGSTNPLQQMGNDFFF